MVRGINSLGVHDPQPNSNATEDDYAAVFAPHSQPDVRYASDNLSSARGSSHFGASHPNTPEDLEGQAGSDGELSTDYEFTNNHEYHRGHQQSSDYQRSSSGEASRLNENSDKGDSLILDNSTIIHQPSIFDRQPMAAGSMFEQASRPITPTQTRPSYHTSSSVSGSVILTPNTTSADQSIAGYGPFVTHTTAPAQSSSPDQLSATLEQMVLQEGLSNAASQKNNFGKSVATSSNTASKANTSIMYSPEKVIEWLDVEDASDAGTSTPGPMGRDVRSKNVSTTATLVEQVIQELMSRGLVNNLDANIVNPAAATVDDVIQELINRGLINSDNTALLLDNVENPTGVAGAAIADTNTTALSPLVNTEFGRAFKGVDLSTVQTFVLTLPVKFCEYEIQDYKLPKGFEKDFGKLFYDTNLFKWHHSPQKWYQKSCYARKGVTVNASVRQSIYCVFTGNRDGSIYNLHRGIHAMLYAILWANALKPVKPTKRRAKFWCIVEKHAKACLPVDRTYLVHVTDRTLDTITELEMRLSREKRTLAFFKGGELHSTVKNDGDFTILEHDEAYALKQDLIDLGTKPVVQ